MTGKTPYPITTLYAWIVDDPSRTHAIMAVMHPANGLPMQACGSRRELMDNPKMRETMAEAAQITRLPIMLCEFTTRNVIDEVKP